MSRDYGLYRLTVDITEELHKRIKVCAANNERSMRSVLVEAIEKKVGSLERSYAKRAKRLAKALERINPK